MRRKALCVAIVLIISTAVLACSGPTPTPPPSGQTPSPQTKGAFANIQVSQDKYLVHAGPYLAVNPLNPRNLLCVAQFLPSPTTDLTRIGTFVSLDGGLTWHGNGLLPNPPGYATDVGQMVTFNAKGIGFIASVARQNSSNTSPARAVLWRTGDGGQSFDPPVTIAQGSNYDHLWLAIDTTNSRYNGTMYLVWQDHNAIVFSRSIDSGHNFSMPRSISNPKDIGPSIPVVTVGSAGAIYVIYADLTQSSALSGAQLEMVRSSDQGRSFIQPHTLPGLPAAWLVFISPTRIFSPITATTDPRNGNLYVAFAVFRTIGPANNQTIEDNTDIMFTSTPDGGQRWTIPARVNDDSLDDSDSHFQPQVAVAGNGDIFISYYTLTNNNIELSLSRSTTHGLSFQHSQVITDTSTDFNSYNDQNLGNLGYFGEQQGLASGPAKVYPIWTDARNGSLEIFTAAVSIG